MSRVIVIGAGLSGLSAACHLTGAGHAVTVLERAEVPGGRAGLIDEAGFRFDTGPTVLTMPNLIADALRAVGADLELLPMRRLDPAYRAVFGDSSEILLRQGIAVMRAEIARTSGSGDAAAFVDFVDWLRRLYRVEVPNFIDTNYNSPLDLLRSPRAAAELLRLGGFGRLGPAVRRYFTDPRLQRLFSFQAMYAGLAPESALALYAVITYMDSIEGVWFPDGGMHALPTALAQAAEKAGATFRYGVEVDQLLRVRAPGSRRGVRSGRPVSGRIAGVRLSDGSQLSADAVVCTIDLPTAYAVLLGDLRPPRAARTSGPFSGRYSPSAVVWHLGVRGIPEPPISHHNIHFGEQWDEAFDALLKRGDLMPDPSRLVTVPSLDDPSLAPPGCSTLYVLEPVPNLQGAVDWAAETPRMKERLLTFLADNGYPTDVVTEHFWSPLTWAAQGMAAGTPFALAHTASQTGPFRPSNVDRRIPGLVFAGSGTQPGVGVPMVVISGKLAAQRVEDYLR